MEIKGRVWLLFEQSGVFKNAFKEFGYEAVDADIQDNFGETDYQIDLFREIETAFSGNGETIFDMMTPEDLVFGFFPCVFFCENNQLYFTGEHQNLKKLSAKEKANVILERSRSRQHLYELALKMFSICEQRGLRLIVENPYAAQHFLVGNFPYKAKLIDRNRGLRGDLYKKPTQYWFLNCEPTYGSSMEAPREHKNIRTSKSGIMAGMCSEDRSMISPEYARNFICDFILGKEQSGTQLNLF